MLSKFLPDEYVKSIFEIKPEALKQRGIKGIITDLDNTLVAWDMSYATPEVIDWFKQMEDADIKVMIVSNNNEERVKKFSDPLERPYIFKARKPLPQAFVKGAKKMRVAKHEVVVIGDQIMTDVLGGNIAGLYTILVVPVVPTDSKITKINRLLERRVLNYMRRKGKINWEE